jgi:hypothetical protein
MPHVSEMPKRGPRGTPRHMGGFPEERGCPASCPVVMQLTRYMTNLRGPYPARDAPIRDEAVFGWDK